MARDLHASGTADRRRAHRPILIAALCAPLVGRRLDARGGRGLMSAGSILGNVARTGLVTGGQPASAVCGLRRDRRSPAAMVLYESAFAVIVSWFDGPVHGRGRANALLALTVVAGFASSIFLPLTGLLVDSLWLAHALVILALIYGAAAIPLHAFAVRRRAPTAERRRPRPKSGGEIVKAATRGRPFWLLVIAFTANGGAVGRRGGPAHHLPDPPRTLARPGRHVGRTAGRAVGDRPTDHHRSADAACPPPSSRPPIFALQGVGRAAAAADRADGGGRDRLRAAVRARLRHRLHHLAAPAGRSGTAPPPTPPCPAASPSSPSPTRRWLRSARSRSPRPPATAG